MSLPAPGHLFPFTSFAHQLAAAGMQVTCFTTGYVFKHLEHRGDHTYKQSSSSSSNDRVRFEGLLDFEEVHEVTIENVMNWCQTLSDEEMGAVLERRFLELHLRPLCIVADMFLGCLQDVANKLHVPRHTPFTMPAKDFAFVIMLPELFAKGELPFNEDGAVKRHISLPSMAPLPPEDVWRSLADSSQKHYQQFKETFERLGEPSSIILNTFEELEAETLKALRTDYVTANIKCTGVCSEKSYGQLNSGDNDRNGYQRFCQFCDQTFQECRDMALVQLTGRSKYPRWKMVGHSSACIGHLHILGSLATLTEEHARTLALALEAAKYPFVWVYRPPEIPQVSRQTTSHSATHKNSHEYFPPGFQDRVSGRAMLLDGWAPHPQIPTHHAIGAFLTHCGWNSILESVCAGVSMLCWPSWADQKINARFVTDTAQVGLRIHRNADGTVNQDEIEKALKQMMEGEEGKATRSKALKFRLLAQKNVAEDGASRTNLDKILQQYTSPSPCHSP